MAISTDLRLRDRLSVEPVSLGACPGPGNVSAVPLTQSSTRSNCAVAVSVVEAVQGGLEEAPLVTPPSDSDGITAGGEPPDRQNNDTITTTHHAPQP